MARLGVAALVFVLTSCWTTGATPTTLQTVQPQAFRLNFQPQPLTPAQSIRQLIYSSDRLADQCAEQATALWCAGYRVYQDAMTEATIRDMDARVRKGFTYVSDVKDTWRIHSTAVMTHQPWQGDCDDLASTTLDVMARHGQPLDKMWLVIVASQAGAKISGRLDHLVAVVEDNAGEFWVVGDTSGKVTPLAEMAYRPLTFAAMSDMQWHDAEAQDAFAQRFDQESWLSRTSRLAAG